MASGAYIGARRSRRLATCALLCLSIGVIPPRASALTQTLTASADSFLNSASPDNNNGHSASIFTGGNGQGGRMRGVIQFTMPAGLQGRVTASSVQLGLTTQAFPNGSSPSAATETLQAISESWVEGNGIGNTMTTYVVGQLCGGSIFGVTWNWRNCSAAANWASPGGSVSASASGSTASPASSGTAVVWPSQAGMVADVQNWIDTPSSNRGWRVASSTEATLGLAQRFVSREGGAGGPSLAIAYDCKAGFMPQGTGCTSCTSAANLACVTTAPGNACVDSGPPATTYACVCDNPAYAVGAGACVDRNACSPNQCDDFGDVGSVCIDHVAPATGYGCVCSHGFHFNGVSCVAAPAAPAAGVGGRILLAFVLGALALTSLRLAAAVR